MGILALMRLMAVKREQKRRRWSILDRNGPIATVHEVKESPFQRAGDGDSRHGKTSKDSIPCLPEDIWRHIHSLMPMRDAARAACLSHAFLRSWRCHPNLTLNWETLCHMLDGRNFCCIIDNILTKHSGIGLKILKLNLCRDDSTFPYIDRWLQMVVTPGIEELTLRLYKKYSFSCSLLSDGVRNSIRYLQLNSCTFRPTAELGPLRSLTSLHLQSVRITGDELGFLLCNALALEQLQLDYCKEIVVLKIPCVLQRFSFLSVVACCRLQVIESKAPNLSHIDISGDIKLLLGEALQMKNLHMDCPDVICYARAELPSIMPNLETLKLSSEDEVVSTPMLSTKFLYLKHLDINIMGGGFSQSYDFISLVSFLDASPSLETLFLHLSQQDSEYESVFGGSSSSNLRKLPDRRHDRLKNVEITGFSSAKALVELICCVIKNAISLEHLVLNTLPDHPRCSGDSNKSCWPIRKTVLEEAYRTVMAIRTYIEDEVPPTAKLTVVEPCPRCHSMDDSTSLKLQLAL